MNYAVNENISDKELIEKIFARDVSEYDLMRELHISDSALRKYKKNAAPTKIRKSEPRMKLIILDFTLTLLEQRGLQNPFHFLKSVNIEGIPLLKFINEYAKDKLVTITIKQALDSRIKDTEQENPLDRYRKKYNYINDETLAVAAKEDPSLLKSLVEDKELRPSVRADILEALSIGGNPEHFEYIKSKLNESAPHIREAAFLGLYEYYDSSPDYKFLKNVFQEKLKDENAEGVKQTINELLEEMQAA